jgi:hypothetical protein
MPGSLLRVRHGAAASKLARKKAASFKVTAIMKAIKFGMLLQMPWTGLPHGLSRACSTEACRITVRNVKNAKGRF